MNLKFEKLGKCGIIKLQGQIDSVGAITLEKEMLSLDQQHEGDFIIDCSELEYINSAGLRVFLLAAKQLASKSYQTVFCGLNQQIHLVFTTIGFDRILTLYPDLEAALAELDPMVNV